MLRSRLDEVTERWGVKVTNVEIREIVPPKKIQEAMDRQMSAERERRALVTESLGPITEEQRHALKVSQEASSRLEHLIEDLIMFSLSSRGELTLKQEPVDIRRLAKLSARSMEQKARERGVNLYTALEDDLPLVQADSQKISWVLGQLLDNAVKFTPSEGRVVLRVERESDSLVMISVSDTGIGIPPNRLEEIFEPFHQLDSASTRRYSGTGLGLSLVRQIVEAHGSMIEVRSVEGKGSVFRFPLLVAATPDEKAT